MKLLPIKGILFDLDGTLLDTAQDLITALEALTHHHSLSSINKEDPELRAAAGRGCKGLLKTGLNIEDSHTDYFTFSEQLLERYADCLLNQTQLFPGILYVIDYLEENKIPWGIVTNKPHRFTEKLVQALHLAGRAQCIVSGDTLTNRKPHPEPLLYAANLMKIPPEHCLYVGDSEIDIIASKAAGMRSIVALYGYIHSYEDPMTWNADGYIEHPEELIPWITKRSSNAFNPFF